MLSRATIFVEPLRQPWTTYDYSGGGMNYIIQTGRVFVVDFHMPLLWTLSILSHLRLI